MKSFLLPFAFAAFAQTPAFEVVSIKSATPTEGGMRVGCRGGPGTHDPGMWACENVSLANLVSNAYGLRAKELDALEWMNQQRFQINAKVPAGVSREQFREMTQQLLAERFRLKAHRVKREMQGYELVVAKGGPKVKDPTFEPPKDADLGKLPAGGPSLAPDGFPQLSLGMTMAVMRDRARAFWPRMTMESLAVILAYQVGGPVTNATGLTGKYDVSLYWVTGSIPAAPPPGGTDAVPTASDPAGPNLFTALQEQAGLKLEPKKVTVDVLVVDHAEKAPTEN